MLPAPGARRCAGGHAAGLAVRRLGPGDAGLLHHHHAIAYDRLSRLMGELFGLQISEGAIANALHRAAKPLAQAGR